MWFLIFTILIDFTSKTESCNLHFLVRRPKITQRNSSKSQNIGLLKGQIDLRFNAV